MPAATLTPPLADGPMATLGARTTVAGATAPAANLLLPGVLTPRLLGAATREAVPAASGAGRTIGQVRVPGLAVPRGGEHQPTAGATGAPWTLATVAPPRGVGTRVTPLAGQATGVPPA